MEKAARRQRDYWQTDFVKTKEQTGAQPNFRKDINPFASKPSPKMFSFIVDWQVCDEEHLS